MGEKITLVAADGHEFSAWRTGRAGNKRALVIGQEIFGVNAHMRAVAETYAAAGYAVIVPALFDRIERDVELRYDAASVERGRAIRDQISEAALIHDVTATAAALQSESIGMVGYCWGATVTWQIATATNLLNAAVCWYGAGIAAMAHRTPNCPVQMHFGSADLSIPPADVEIIRTAHPDADVNVYMGAPHGFGCEARDSFMPDAYELAQERTLIFFNRFMPSMVSLAPAAGAAAAPAQQAAPARPPFKPRGGFWR